MVRAVRKLIDQPLPLFIAVALTTAAAAFGIMELTRAVPDASARVAIAAPQAEPSAMSALPGPRLR
jgi:hypothetical protein